MSCHLVICPLCGGLDIAPLLKARDFHYGNPGLFTLVQCTGCTLAFIDPMYDDAELAAFYPKSYYSFGDRFLTDPPLHSLREKIKRLIGLREVQTKDPKFSRPGRMLDVGCGSGWFLCKMRDEGWEVKGVEPSEAAAHLGRSQQGLDIFAGALTDAAFPAESFDYIRFNHSFEHVNDPNRTLGEVYRILAKDGKLMIGVPNRASMNAKFFGQFWHHLALPLHTFSYSPKTLSAMLAKHSFDVKNVVYNAGSMGICGSLQMFANRKNKVIRSDGSIIANRWVRLFSTWAAGLENWLRISDVIEVTAVKR